MTHATKCCKGGGHAPVRCSCDCTCDGYHTFDELYEHRITLFIALCKKLVDDDDDVWRSELHHDGSSYDGWFIVGIGAVAGEQISYHLPMDKWNKCNFIKTVDRAPKWDGHTSDDVLERLEAL